MCETVGALSQGTYHTSYVPNFCLQASKGFTVPELENDLKKSAPCEDGFLNDPGAKSRAIIVTNYTDKDISVVLNEATPLNKSFPDARWNEVEIDGFMLPKGCSSHFSVPPYCYDISVTEHVIDEHGVVQQLTREGFALATLQNQVLTYHDGDGQGLTEPVISQAQTNHFCCIENDSSNDITVTVSKKKTAYPLSDEQIQRLKDSRSPDFGSQKIASKRLVPGARWNYKPKQPYYYVRGLETPGEAEGEDYHADHLFGQDCISQRTNYVEKSYIKAKAGDWAFFLKDLAENGGVVAKVYKAREIKPVQSTIVRTTRTAL